MNPHTLSQVCIVYLENKKDFNYSCYNEILSVIMCFEILFTIILYFIHGMHSRPMTTYIERAHSDKTRMINLYDQQVTNTDLV